jgi:hypothetical protein
MNPFRVNARLIAATGFALALLSPSSVSAQEDQLRLGMRRTFGYAWGSDIQGSFLLVASGPAEVDQVAFYVDQDLLETVTAPPFEARLHTGDYPVGVHQLQAVGTRSDGSTLHSNVIRVEFVSAEAGWESAAGLLTPVLLVVGLAVAVSIGMTAISSRRYRPGSYGSSGGAVCPRCHLPLARHFLAPNIGLKKLERCPHCGRWSLVSRASAEDLVAAEARLKGETPPGLSPEAEAAALQHQVEDSRFTE